MRHLFWLPLAALLGACGVQAEKPSASSFTSEQLAARYYFDLGPATIDVADYPPERQAQYRNFLKHCSPCHTTARAINAPVVRREDWRRYIRRMHERGESRGWLDSVPVGSFAELVDFLAYDSQLRKVQKRDEFTRRTGELQVLFDQVKAERRRLGRAAEDQPGS